MHNVFLSKPNSKKINFKQKTMFLIFKIHIFLEFFDKGILFCC